MKSETNLRSRLKEIKEVVKAIDEHEAPSKLTRNTSCKVLHCHPPQKPLIFIENSSNKKAKANKTESILEVPEPTFYSPRHTRTTKAAV